MLCGQRELDLALDETAVRDAAGGGNAARDARRLALHVEAVDGHRALCDRVDLAIGAQQRRHEERAALQADEASPSVDTETSMRVPCVAKAGRFAVTMTAATLAVRMFSPRVLTPSRSSMACRLWRVKGELLSAVAGAVEADDEAVADELVVADALDVDDVLDARGGRGRIEHRQHGGEGEAGGQNAPRNCQFDVRACHSSRSLPNAMAFSKREACQNSCG